MFGLIVADESLLVPWLLAAWHKNALCRPLANRKAVDDLAFAEDELLMRESNDSTLRRGTAPDFPDFGARKYEVQPLLLEQ